MVGWIGVVWCGVDKVLDFATCGLTIVDASPDSTRKFGFELQTNVKSFKVCAASQKEKDDWLSALKQNAKQTTKNVASLMLPDATIPVLSTIPTPPLTPTPPTAPPPLVTSTSSSSAPPSPAHTTTTLTPQPPAGPRRALTPKPPPGGPPPGSVPVPVKPPASPSADAPPPPVPARPPRKA